MDNCKEISVIPQFGGTCWFNAILMIVLYSQNMRKILIKEAKNWSNPNSFLKIIKSILKNYDKPEKVREFFAKIKPELILFKMLKSFDDKEMIKFLKTSIKNGSDIGYYHDYIIRFLKYIGINTLDIVVIKQKGWVYNSTNYLLNTDKEFSYIYDTKNKSRFSFLKDFDDFKDEIKKKTKKTKVFEEIKKILTDIPDVLIVKHEEVMDNTLSKDNYNFMNYYIPEFNGSSYSSSFMIRGLDTYNDIIYLNGHKYKLEAVTLENYNYDDNEFSHAICGITCNNNRYVYNGWNAQTNDPSLKTTGSFVSPCALIKYDWDLRKDEPFCLNINTCKLDFLKSSVDKDNLCFSFAKGERILIYARVDDETTVSEDLFNSHNSDIKLSSVSDVIKNIYDIDGLKNEEIVGNLKKYYNITVSETDKDNREKLQKYYYDQIKKDLHL